MSVVEAGDAMRRVKIVLVDPLRALVFMKFPPVLITVYWASFAFGVLVPPSFPPPPITRLTENSTHSTSASKKTSAALALNHAVRINTFWLMSLYAHSLTRSPAFGGGVSLPFPVRRNMVDSGV